jgi:hypothetical protein
MSSYGLFAALAFAPIGGSLAAIAGGLLLAWRRNAAPPRNSAMEVDPIDEQVAALRRVLEVVSQAHSSTSEQPSGSWRAA